jgi:hypothetical protein
MTTSIFVAVLLVLSTITAPFVAIVTLAVSPSVVKTLVAFAVFLVLAQVTPHALACIAVLALGRTPLMSLNPYAYASPMVLYRYMGLEILWGVRQGRLKWNTF